MDGCRMLGSFLLCSANSQPVVVSTRRVAWLLWLTLLLTGLVEWTVALQCPPLSQCDPLTPCDRSVLAKCAGGVVRDVCGCCDTCAKVENETCGGLHGLKGECDEGLICVFVNSKVYPPLGDEEGICQAKPKECQDVKCDAIPPSCPIDSLPGWNFVLEGGNKCCPKQPTCHCNLDSCHDPTCNADHEPRLLRRATGRPGECCDVYECQYTGPDCSSVKCPPASPECPADSYALPNILPSDGCCSKPQGCACLPDFCKPVKCPDGQRLKVIVHGDNRPGSCCTLFHCIREGEQTCLYEGEEYVEGSVWKVDKCTTCSCKNNITFCNSVECNITSYCGRMEVPEGECCPVCTGCISSSGAFFANGASWQKDDCTSCTCIDGEVQCQAEFCTVHCANPKKIPGQCCPRCEDGPSVVTIPPHCPSLENCTKICVHGYRKDDKDCYVCDCRLDMCNLVCENGYETDAQGNHICQCKCPPLNDCDKKCLHGFRYDSRGACRVCKCAKCRSLKCSKECPYGHVLNDRGCRTCRCANITNLVVSPHEDQYETTVVVPVVTDVPTKPGVSLPPTFITDYCIAAGILHDDGEYWHDGCRNCYCHGGKEMCSLINCPNLSCTQHVFVPGDCCPRCRGDNAKARKSNDTVCQAIDGVLHVEGETWSLDSCIHCICHNGQALCRATQCPPVACANPKLGDDRCCPECPYEIDDGGIGLPCLFEGREIESGAVWREDCQSCRCSNGQVMCFSDKCPHLTCDKPVLIKGHCCPFCLTGEALLPSCIFKGIPYVSGEVWRENECSLCSCADGKITCKEKYCPKIDCGGEDPIRKPGECCTSCPDVTVKEHDDCLPRSQILSIVLWVCGLLTAIFLVAIAFCCLRSRCRCYSMKKKNSVLCFQSDSEFDPRLELNNRGSYKLTSPPSYHSVQYQPKSGS